MKPVLGDRVFLNECPPDTYRVGEPEPRGHVCFTSEERVHVTVADLHGGSAIAVFDLDGSTWSACGRFKREAWDYKPESEKR